MQRSGGCEVRSQGPACRGKGQQSRSVGLPSATWGSRPQSPPQWLWGSRPSSRLPSAFGDPTWPPLLSGQLTPRNPCASQLACPTRPRYAPPPIVTCSHLSTSTFPRSGRPFSPGLLHAPAGLHWEGSSSRACTFPTPSLGTVEAVRGRVREKRGSGAMPCVTFISPTGTSRGAHAGGQPGLPRPACPLP